MKILDVDFQKKCLNYTWEEQGRQENLEKLSATFRDALDIICLVTENEQVKQDCAVILGRIMSELRRK